MYPRIPCERVTIPAGSAQHTLRTAALDYRVSKHKILERALVKDENNTVPCDGFHFEQLQGRKNLN